ncbi:hypothetical protein SAMN05444003_2785 [Cognatiyoonia sediminum]|uniref:Uncharacterized protein n=1 Tax=Cognatiyoonia sediminum TaxID=1508389 RepID=A0A1M5S061_9RHOB|nr:hypothetical protein [Cognatiyoonia sediminum]SHH31781.1 hypothetical protein SAMN05444003_2785 [Cognatiyoonia sediminum]
MRVLTASLFLCAGAAVADPVEIVAVDASKSGDTWRFSVTLQHPDTGWDHYADAWEVLDADGNRLGIRELAHPHVNEQPFTRSQSGILIPEDMDVVYIRARENVDGWNETTTEFVLPK